MKYLVFIFFLVSILNGEIYRNSPQQIVVDEENRLVWQDTKDTIQNKKKQKDALEYCENLNFASYSNWRLPTSKEYKTIVDKKNFKTNINSAFKYNLRDSYWSSTTHWRTFWFYADYMFFVSGTVYYDNREKKKYVRCIRDY